MLDRDLRQINIAKHPIEMCRADSNEILSVPCQAGRKERKFENNDIDKLLLQEVMESAQTEWVE